MPNAAEIIEKLTREAEERKILDIARKCKDLQELIEKLEAMLEGK